MKKHLMLIVSLVNTAMTAAYIAFLPKSEIPMHYNTQGVCDRYGSKWELMIMPLALFLPVIIYYVYSFFKSDKDDSKNKKYLSRVAWGLFCVLFILFWIMIFVTSNGTEQLGSLFIALILMLMGALMIFIGNFYGKIKQNSTLGIKTHATLKNDVVWRKTHRLGGYLAVLSGALWIIGGVIALFISEVGFYIFIPCLAVMLLLMAVIPLVYSEMLYHRIKNKSKSSNA